MGSNTKFTEEIIQKLEEAIKLGAAYEHACNYAGITYQTFRNWMNEGEAAKSGKKKDFADRMRQAKGDATKHWLEVIENSANEGNWQAAAWKLERRHFADYGKHTKQQVTSQNLNANLSDLTDEQLKRLAAGEDLASILSD